MNRKTLLRLGIGLLFLVAIVVLGSRVLKMGDTFKTLAGLDLLYLVPRLAPSRPIWRASGSPSPPRAS
jgi:hypothetical protein